jgi:hypothetical protein
VSALRDAAFAYAAAGLPILPCESGGKAPHRMLEGPPLCLGGVYHATTNAERVAHWWDEDPSANVGVDVLALDLDDWSALGLLTREQRRDLLRGAWVGTARGVHVWFRAPEPVKGGRVVSGLSLQGAGTYVLAPPSVHPSGIAYEWLSDGTRWRNLAPLPDWARPRRTLKTLGAAERVPSCRTDYIGRRAIAEMRAKLGRHSREPGSGRGTALYAAARFLSEYVGVFLSLDDARSELRVIGDWLFRLDEDKSARDRKRDETEREHNIASGLGLAEPRGKAAA